MKFARQENGSWCDPKEAVSLAALDTHYHPDWVAARKAANAWFQVITDPAFDALMPKQPLQDRGLARGELRDYLVTQLSTKLKVGAILAAFKASADGTVAFYYDDFDNRSFYAKSDIVALLTFLRSKDIGGVNYITVADITAVNNNWPQA